MKPSRQILSLLILTCAALLLPAPHALAQDGDSSVRTALMYLPNRVLDVFDVVRLSAKIGQGIAGGARVTREGELFIGTYTSLYVGLPGPRGRPDPRWPVGFEDREEKPGMAPSETSVPRRNSPRYGRGEIGLDLFPFVVGAGVGVDPFELVDLLAGFFLIDPAGDEL